MKKNIFISLALLAVCQAVMAVPAKRGVYKTLRLDNGQEIRAMLVGDEHGHFWKGDDGRAYVLNGNSYISVDEKAIMEKARASRLKANAKTTRRSAPGDPINFSGYRGNKKGLVILVNFADKKFQNGHDKALFNRITNEEHFHEGDFVGSVADYFKDQSNGQFCLNFDVVGPVTVSKKEAYYGKNDDYIIDMKADEMVAEAVNLVKDQNLVTDWRQYDWNGDGMVDQVFLIYAGLGEADGGDEDTVWPHQSVLGYNAVRLGNNLKVDTYACSSELNGTGKICGIGTMCHEFSHCLDIPDFYDTGDSGGQGMGIWDIMDQGVYLADGYHPAGYTSYERWLVGWQEPIELNDEDVTVTNMKSLQDGGESYIIYNKRNRNEFYLLENRQFDNWDASLPNRGLLIVHVDYNADIWASNGVNSDISHQRVTVVPADGKYEYVYYEDYGIYYTWDGMRTDPFPQNGVSAFNRSFRTYDDQARLAARLFKKNIDDTYLIDSSVENITQHADGTISFNFVAAYTGEAPDEGPIIPQTIDLSNITTTYTVTDSTTLTGTLNNNVNIRIDDGATVILSGVNIPGKYDKNYLWAGLSCMGDATIILADGTENTVRGYGNNHPGIYVPKGNTLTIRGSGSLIVGCDGYGAGIGGGAFLDCGNICIEGGSIYAMGGAYAAGIGGGYGTSCGDITITSGVTIVTANAGYAANSVGAGYGDNESPSSCGTVTIGDVVTGSISGNPFVYTPTDIKSISVSPETDWWYTLDGRRFNGKPVTKGVYINKGRKVVIP